MSSLLNIKEFLEEQPVKKRRVDNLKEMPENAKQNDANLPKSTEADNNKVLETSTTMADLPTSVGPHRKLPAELNCQIFYCLKLTTRRKFILGLGWNFYAMFRHSLLTKSKRICNPQGNGLRRFSKDVTISEDGLIASNNTTGWKYIFAEKGFPISVANCRTDGFPGTICYYYEVKSLSKGCVVGLLHGENVFGLCIGLCNRRLYIIATILTNGHYEYTEVPVGARPEQNAQENVYGCGILIDPDNKLTTFFTLNGILLGKEIPFIPSVDRLFPAVSIFHNALTFEANFGDDKDKPFQYDIKKCPGMGLDCN